MDAPGNTPALHYARTQADRSHRNTTGQGFCEAENIRLQVIVVTGKERSRTPKARLHFINNQQDPAFTAQCCKTLHVFIRSHVNTSFPLHQFNDYCRGLLIDGCSGSREIVITYMADIGNERREGLTVVRFPCCRKRTHRATMEAPQRRNYSWAPGGNACKFDGPLHSLGTAVA